MRYEIVIKGHFDKNWDEWFEGMKVSPLPDGETQISGNIKDQSQLHGIINKIRDLGILLVKVEQKDGKKYRR